MALSGNDERVTAETALRIGLVTEVVDARRAVGPGPRDRRRHRAQADGRDAGHRARDLGVARPARTAPRWSRACIYTRLGNPIGMAEVAEHGRRPARAADPLMAGRRPTALPRPAHRARSLAHRPDGAGARVRAALAHVGRARRRPPTRSPRIVDARARGSACCCATARRTSGCCSACCAPARCVVDDQPRARAPSASAPTSRRSTCRRRRRRARRPRRARRRRQPRRRRLAARRRSASRSWSTGDRAPATAAPDRAPGVAVEMLTSGTTGPPKRIDLTYETLERVLVGAKHYETQPRRRRCGCASGVAIVNSPLVHLGGLFRVLQCVNDGRSFCLLERFTVDELGRRRAPPPPGDRRASCRPRCAWCSTPTSTRPTSSSVRSVVSGTAPLSPDDADAFLDQVRHPGARSRTRPPSSAAASPAGTSPTTEQFWATKRGSVGRAHAGCELRVVDPDDGRAARARRGGPARGEGRPARRRRGLDPHHRPRPHRRRRLPLDPRPGRPGDHPRRLQGAARRRARRARTHPARARRGRRRAAPTRGSARCRSPPSSCAPGAEPVDGRRPARARSRRSSRATSCPTEIRIVDALPRTDVGQGRPRRACRPSPLLDAGA